MKAVLRPGRVFALVAALATVAFGGVGVETARSVPPALSYTCSPAPANCSGWYRTPVTVNWGWFTGTAEYFDGDCVPDPNPSVTYSGDTRGRVTWCEVRDIASGDRTTRTFVLHIDKSPPSVAPVPQRRPDYGGWYNHPVSVSFRGSDATSGVASCSSATYSGPDRARVSIGGSCRDVAGNVGVGSTVLNYDATPPAPPNVDAKPRNKRVLLSWSGAAGAQSEVVRFRGRTPVGVVYRGPGRTFTDKRLRNGRRYRYLVVLIDQAGNRAWGRAGATPTASKLFSPVRGARVRSAPLLEWKKGKRIRYWNVQLYRNREKIFTYWPRSNTLQLKNRWRFRGRRYRMVPGRYCWHVWPGIGKLRRHKYGRKLGESCFRVVR
jgi:hypothetical protein